MLTVQIPKAKPRVSKCYSYKCSAATTGHWVVVDGSMGYTAESWGDALALAVKLAARA